MTLNGNERYRLFIRQSFTTPGIYIKTGFFTIHDQVGNSPPEWGDAFEVFLNEPVHDRHNFSCKNSFTSLGNAAVGWEPRYDRCKCDGFWPRARHAIVRNFVTYDRSEKHLRPQLMPYVGSFGAGVITATWQPGNPDYLVKGYQSAVTRPGLAASSMYLESSPPKSVGSSGRIKNDAPNANALQQQPIHLHVLIYCRRSN